MARIIGLPSVSRVRKGGSWWYQCEGWGCFGLGSTRKEAFDNWKETAKEDSANRKQQAATEDATK